jgi:hypothetical protein
MANATVEAFLEALGRLERDRDVGPMVALFANDASAGNVVSPRDYKAILRLFRPARPGPATARGRPRRRRLKPGAPPARGATEGAPRGRGDKGRGAVRNSAPMSSPALSAPGGGLVGVVHLPPLPGDPLAGPGTSFAHAEARALADAEALVEGGVDALVVENFGSAPFFKGTAGDRAPPHQVAALALVARALVARFGKPVGVNCLRNDAPAALGAAAAAGASFARVNVHVGAMVTDQGLIEGEAAHTLRYRLALGARDVALWADVLVKHAAPLAPLDAGQAARDCLERGLADALIVTGAATGEPVALERLRDVAEAARGRAPVWLGSGLTPESATTLAPLAQGAIVGTWFKRGGDVRAPVDVGRVRELVAAARHRFAAPRAALPAAPARGALCAATPLACPRATTAPRATCPKVRRPRHRRPPRPARPPAPRQGPVFCIH